VIRAYRQLTECSTWRVPYKEYRFRGSLNRCHHRTRILSSRLPELQSERHHLCPVWVRSIPPWPYTFRCLPSWSLVEPM